MEFLSNIGGCTYMLSFESYLSCLVCFDLDGVFKVVATKVELSGWTS